MRPDTKLQDFVTVLPEPVIPLVAFPVGVIHQIIETQTVDHLRPPLHSPVGRAANSPGKRAHFNLAGRPSTGPVCDLQTEPLPLGTPVVQSVRRARAERWAKTPRRSPRGQFQNRSSPSTGPSRGQVIPPAALP